MTSRETDDSVFADVREVGLMRAHASRMIGHRRNMRDRYPEQWEPFSNDFVGIDYYVSMGTYVMAAISAIDPHEATQRLAEVDGGMSIQVAIEKEMGEMLNNCINDPNMTLDQFFVYTEMGIVFAGMTGNQPAAELLRRYLDEPDECLI